MVRSRSGRSGCIIDMPLSFRDTRLRVDTESRDSGFDAPRRPGMTISGLRNPMTPTDIEKIFRDEAGRALATLIRFVGAFDLAEDALQDAFAVALQRWPAADPPANPRAWLVNVGRNKAIDRVRRQIAFRGKQGELVRELLHNAATCEKKGAAAARPPRRLGAGVSLVLL